MGNKFVALVFSWEMNYRSAMRFRNKAYLLLGNLLLAQTLWAVTPNLKENYQPIIDRNPFGLKPPAPPPTNGVAVVPEKPKMEIFLTGIASIGYPKWPKRVYLKTQDAKNKKEEKLFDLQEGQEAEGIKVLSIDEINKKVRIQTDGGETLLTFETHGMPPPVAAAPTPGQPGVPGQPGGIPGQPGAPVPLPAVRQANANIPQVGQTPSTSGITQNTPGNYRTIPSRSIRSRMPGGTDFSGGNSPGYNTPGGQPVPDQPQMDPVEQYLRMSLDKTAKEQQGIPMPPLPPVQ